MRLSSNSHLLALNPSFFPSASSETILALGKKGHKHAGASSPVPLLELRSRLPRLSETATLVCSKVEQRVQSTPDPSIISPTAALPSYRPAWPWPMFCWYACLLRLCDLLGYMSVAA